MDLQVDREGRLHDQLRTASSPLIAQIQPEAEGRVGIAESVYCEARRFGLYSVEKRSPHHHQGKSRGPRQAP